MICKLCNKDLPLRKSHIIPEFFYRPGYDEKGRLFAMYEGILKDRYIQKGIREELLCGGCEQFLNDNYEKYFYSFWYKKQNMPSKADGNVYWVRGIEYGQFKLFLLSILWRAGVAKGKDYASVSLGPHEKIIRNMILKKDPGPETKYQIFAVLLLLPGTKDICSGFIMPPIASHIDARHLYVFAFGGCVWNFVVSSHPFGVPVDGFALSDKGTMLMPTIDLTDFPPVDKFMKSQIKAFKIAASKSQWGHSI